MSSHRQQRVRELLKREIGEAIRRELPVHDCGLINVNDVTISADLRSATVYVGFLGKPDQQKPTLELLQSQRKRIQALLARAVILKYTPQLRFVVDDSVSRGVRVLEIIAELEKDSPAQ